MKKKLKYLLIVLCLISFSSCKKNNDNNENMETSGYEEVEYVSFPIEELEKLDSYVYKSSSNDTTRNYTYYFKDDKCVGTKEEFTFNNAELAKKYYEEVKDSNEAVDLKIDNNKVSYYLKSEYVEYLLYPKKTLIDLLNSIETE